MLLYLDLLGTIISYIPWQWLWLSWYQHQRSMVQIQSSAKFILNIVYSQLYIKDKNKEKEAGNGPFFEKRRTSHDPFEKGKRDSNPRPYDHESASQPVWQDWAIFERSLSKTAQTLDYLLTYFKISISQLCWHNKIIARHNNSVQTSVGLISSLLVKV